MGKPTLRILDSVHCKANKYARPLILPALAYKTTSWRRGRYGKKNDTIVKSHLITGRTGTAGMFFTGLLPRIKKHCKKRGHKIRIIGREERIRPTQPPKLKGIVFRPDQLEALKEAHRRRRGLIIFPTGSGKTIIALGIISMFEDEVRNEIDSLKMVARKGNKKLPQFIIEKIFKKHNKDSSDSE